MSVIIGLIILLCVCVAVKLFDADIRASRYGKYIVVWVTVCDLFFLLFSTITLIFGG